MCAQRTNHKQAQTHKDVTQENMSCVRVCVCVCVCVCVFYCRISGMSYVMEFVDASKVDENSDSEIKFDGFKVVVDPKSLMFVYGMTLDYRYTQT